MAVYDFRCMKCDHIEKDVHMPITHQREDLPFHCGDRMSYHITQAPMVSWIDPVIEPFRNPAAVRGTPDSVISSTKQRREFMAKNDLVDGNDFKPPTSQEHNENHIKAMKEIAAITPTAEQSDRLMVEGILNNNGD